MTEQPKEQYGRSYMIDVELPRARARNKAMYNAIRAINKSRAINAPTSTNKSTDGQAVSRKLTTDNHEPAILG